MDKGKPMGAMQLEERAAGYFARRQGSNWSKADEAAFQAWRQESLAHHVAYLRLEATWDEAARLNAFGAGVAPGVIPPRGWSGGRIFSSVPQPERSSSSRKSLPASRRRYLSFAVAASMFLALVGGLYFYQADRFIGHQYATSIGTIDTVPLADGSHVTLNSDSQIRVDLEARERRVELDRGEAFFQVAKDEARPFVVDVGNKRVIAVGTQFSVYKIRDHVRVTVLEGTVRMEDRPARSLIAPPSTSSSRKASTSSSADSIVLHAGAIARATKEDVLVQANAAPEVVELLSWRAGFVVFHDTTLADAVDEFNRYGTRKIVIRDPSIATIRIGGNFRLNNAEGFLWLLRSGFPITAEEEGNQVILKHR